MTNEELSVLAEPVSNVFDGWSGENGELHLGVQCQDGVVRYITIKRRTISSVLGSIKKIDNTLEPK